MTDATDPTKPVAWRVTRYDKNGEWLDTTACLYKPTLEPRDRLDIEPLVLLSEYERVKAERDEAVAKLNDLISEDAAPTSLFERYEARSEALEAEVKRLCNLLNDTVVAWEALPGGQQSVKVVEKWLAEKMSAAINRIRAALEAS